MAKNSHNSNGQQQLKSAFQTGGQAALHNYLVSERTDILPVGWVYKRDPTSGIHYLASV